MKNITRDMLEIYEPYSGLDWLNYKLVRKDMTFHHIIKKEHGGKEIIENGLLLMPVAHQYLHLIECFDYPTYGELTEIFKIINKQRKEPTQEEREAVEYLLQKFEYDNRWKKSSKGKLLIKREYLKRF